MFKMTKSKKKVESKRIEGNPTKELFVHILTRDLSIEDAINDLIDNSIDGAKRLRKKGDYKGLYVHIEIDKNRFKISDNCGGIPIDLARQYAFRFGRPSNMPDTDYSIGQFGVGMKRAIFKLGTSFYVESKAKNSEFEVLVDINDWLNKKDEHGNDDWSFEFQDFRTKRIKTKEDKTGTSIEIEPLRKSLAKYVATKRFIDGLKAGIENKHMQNIYQGITIKVNGEKLKSKRPEFIVSELIKVAKWEKTYENGVKVLLYAGIGDDVLEDGGWYIFCNDRLLLGPEQTALSGWTGKGGGGVANYHQQYCRFRGLAYFLAENAKDLPWNTSKNNIDASSPIFLNTRAQMIELMKPIHKFLNLMKKEREKTADGADKKERPYERAVQDGSSADVSNLNATNTESSFVIPDVVVEAEEQVEMVNITYRKPKEIVEKVKKALKAKSLKKIGEGTFDYFVKMEEIDYE